jgi:hypothetical protein
LLGPKLAGDAQLMQVAILMAQSQYELRPLEFARDADDNAVGSAVALDFYPVSPPSRIIATVAPLRHDAFDDTEEGQPLSRNGNLRCLLHQLQTGMPMFPQQLLELAPSGRQRLVEQAHTPHLEHIEDDENSGLLRGFPHDVIARERQPRLEGAKVYRSVLVGDNNLAVDQRVGREFERRL